MVEMYNITKNKLSNEDKEDRIIQNYFKNHSNPKINYCEKCNNNFSNEYTYCPLCSNELVKVPTFLIDEEKRLVYGKWNENLISIDFQQLYFHLTVLSDPFPWLTFFDVFRIKEKWDLRFDISFINQENKPSRLSCQELYNFYEEYRLIKYNFNNNKDIGFMIPEMIEDRYKEFNFEKEIQINEIQKIIVFEIRPKELYYLLKIYQVNNSLDYWDDNDFLDAMSNDL